jgi:hypothetical protein
MLLLRKFVCLVLFLTGFNRGALAVTPDAGFLDELERRSFRFFWDEADPKNGLIPDRAGADAQMHFPICSIASVGFGLTAICAADHRQWIDHQKAYQRVLTTLRFLNNQVPHEHGFFYHFVDLQHGERRWQSEVSSLDTALLMAGVLTVRQYYSNSEASQIATKLYERVDWPWMLNGGTTFSMGWRPETGFLPVRWDGYSEHMILDLLALGSSTHPVSPEIWQAWRRTSLTSYAGRTYLQCPSLFTYQYSHAWIDFRDKRDAYADYWRNSVLATEAHRQFCIDLHSRFPNYGDQSWGITASDGPDGYKSWGGPPATQTDIDGTLVPCAAGGSIPFLPRECIATLEHLRDVYGNTIWKRYGFVDAFNPQTGWTDPDVIGIDVGITLLMAENYQSGFVWAQFMKNPEIQHALCLAGFHNTSRELPWADQKYLKRLERDTWNCIDSLVEPLTGLPYENNSRPEYTSIGAIGLYLTDVVAAQQMHFIDSSDANCRVARVLDSLDDVTRQGFGVDSISVRTLNTSTNDFWSSANQAANLEAGLITAGQDIPDLRERCNQIVARIHWARFYRKSENRFFAWLNNNPDLPPQHPVTLLADDRMASFFSIASGVVPAEFWENLSRGFEEKEHVTYLESGPGMGLEAQYEPSLWLDERGTLMDLSAQNNSFAQMSHAAAAGLPAWGWATMITTPDFLGSEPNDPEKNVVQPFACALAIEDYPNEVVANFRSLEKLGARDSELGFVASFDLTSQGRSPNLYRVDFQSLLFVSLANYLHKDVILRLFQSDSMVQHARQCLADYRQPSYSENVAVLDLGVLTHNNSSKAKN